MPEMGFSIFQPRLGDPRTAISRLRWPKYFRLPAWKQSRKWAWRVILLTLRSVIQTNLENSSSELSALVQHTIPQRVRGIATDYGKKYLSDSTGGFTVFGRSTGIVIHNGKLNDCLRRFAIPWLPPLSLVSQRRLRASTWLLLATVQGTNCSSYRLQSLTVFNRSGTRRMGASNGYHLLPRTCRKYATA